jgi:hypothetical protein
MHMKALYLLVVFLGVVGCSDKTTVMPGEKPASPPTSIAPPSIQTQPADQNVPSGQTATFSVVATSDGALTYQWKKGATPISGATAASYTTPITTAADNGAIFMVVVANLGGSTPSSGAKLTVTSMGAAAPAITMQPANQQVIVGHSATFTVVAGGTGPFTYQWKKNASSIEGATASSYTTPATLIGDNGSTFSVIVGNGAGSVASKSATLTVTSEPVTTPTIITQPANQMVMIGQSATFSVVADGTGPFTYQWRKNSSPISGATAAAYTTPATTASDNGTGFSVIIANAGGTATSNSATLTVETPSTTGGTDVTTYKNDVMRSGANLTETALTTMTVSAATFGLLRKLPVDGRVDAQPLYLSQLRIAGGTSDTVFVATENDSVYAFDADSGMVLWHVSLLPNGESPSDTLGCAQVSPHIGVTSTPVIDRNAGAHGTMFVVAMSKDASSTYHQRLHALDIATGAELLGGPVEVVATFPAAAGGTSTFQASKYEERAALLLVNGTIYTSWTSHCDVAPYGGWVIAYDESSLSRSGVLNLAANSSHGPAIWMAGGGPGADSAGNIYLLTANGVFETALDAKGFPNKQDYGNSFLKLSRAGAGLAVMDYFTMFNEVAESNGDQDLGSGGAMLLPDMKDSAGAVRHLMVGAGKDSNIYVVDRDSMGKFNASGNHNYQTLSGALPGGIWSTPAYFNGNVYYGSVSANLKAFKVSSAKLLATPMSQSATQFTYPGTAPSVSANGATNGIVWAHENTNPAVLHAYDAADLAHELYNSNQAPDNRDHFGAGNKFITPMIADGKVFVGATGSVAVFGLLHGN